MRWTKRFLEPLLRTDLLYIRLIVYSTRPYVLLSALCSRVDLEKSPSFRHEAKVVTRGDVQCNGRSDGTRVPCYKDPMYAPSSSLQLVTRERDFDVMLAQYGSCRRSPWTPHELSILRNACGQDLDLDRTEEDPRWQRARRRRERGTFYWIIWMIVRGTAPL